MIAEGFDHQKGSVFGFVKNSGKDTDKNIVKIRDLSDEQVRT